jgi:hypothetical protein
MNLSPTQQKLLDVLRAIRRANEAKFGADPDYIGAFPDGSYVGNGCGIHATIRGCNIRTWWALEDAGLVIRARNGAWIAMLPRERLCVPMPADAAASLTV